MMKLGIILLVLMFSVSANAIDQCNPYVKKSVRDEVICQIKLWKKVQADPEMSRSAKTASLFIDERQQLLDAIDAKKISPTSARSALESMRQGDIEYLNAGLKSLAEISQQQEASNARLNAQLDDLRLQSERFTPPPMPFDVTCKKQYDDSVRCR